MFQVYSTIFTMLEIFRFMCPHSGMFRQIQAYLESWQNQTYSCILRHIQSPRHIQNHRHSFRHVILFRDYSRAIYAYSEPYLGRFRYIQIPDLFRHIMFHSHSRICTKLHLSRNICPHSGIFQQIRHIQDACITGPNSVNQHLLLKSSSSFKSLFKSFWNIYSFLFQKQIFKIFVFRTLFQ